MTFPSCLLRIAFAVLLVMTRHAQGCSCGPPHTPLKAMAVADAVFSGEIIDIVPKSHDVPDEQMVDGFKATVKVIKSWKGNVAGTVAVHTGSGFGDCGIEFKEESYLFYVYRNKDGEWSTNVCTRTAPLKTTGEETLELDGHLPELKDPPQEPVLEFKGKINDAGYNGYVFTLRNRLHKRIFYFGYQNPGAWVRVQVQHDGQWVDTPPNTFAPTTSPPKEDDNERIRWWQEEYAKLKVEENAGFVERLQSLTMFVGNPVKEATWRIGLQYEDEVEVDAGKKLQQSEHYIWSDSISPDAPAKALSFKEAFEIPSDTTP